MRSLGKQADDWRCPKNYGNISDSLFTNDICVDIVWQWRNREFVENLVGLLINETQPQLNRKSP